METVRIRREAKLAQLRRLRPLEQPLDRAGTGVLLSDQIIRLSTEVEGTSKMIEPFHQDQLHPAGYKLTVGSQFALGGTIYALTRASRDSPAHILIPPFQVAIIQTEEILCIPRFVIARWNILVKHAYKGLLWVGAAQVDPGWVGHLACPIYNLSNKAVKLERGDDLALIDFVTTTPVPARYLETAEPHRWERYSFPEDKVVMEDYNVELESALFTEGAEKIAEVSSRQRELDTKITTFSTIVMVALAAVPALLASVALNQSALSTSIWGPAAIFFSVAAFLLVISETFGSRIRPRTKPTRGRIWQWSQAAIALVVAFGIAMLVGSQTREANNQLLEAINLAGIEKVSDLISDLRAARRDQATESIGELVADREELQAAQRGLEARIEALEAQVVRPTPEAE